MSLALRALALAWVGALVAAPIGALLWRGLAVPWEGWRAALADPIGQDALWLSLWTAALASLLNGIVGGALAWALVRWEFPGRRWLEALVELPIAIPTLVAGILIVALYGPQAAVGGALAGVGFPIAFARPGVVLALLFVSLPLVVRAVEPVLEELDPAEEEAAAVLGATPWMTFRRVILPPLLPALGAGMVQTFARSLAEFGSLSVVSGNLPHQTLTVPVYVLGEVEGANLDGATVYALLLLAAALVLHPLAGALARLGGHRG